MATLKTLATDQLETFETYLKARPFTEKEREYWQLCWLEVDQPTIDKINAALPPNNVVEPRTLGGKLYINADLLSDAVDGGRLADILGFLDTLLWSFIDPWKWEEEAETVEAWKPYDGTPATIYDIGKVVSHNNKKWVSTTPKNVWEPGVFGYREMTDPGLAPTWRQPLGAGDAWQINDEVFYKDRKWKSLVRDNVWAPGTVGLWEDVTKTKPDEVVVPDWKQPAGAHDAYRRGARVKFQNKIYENTGSDANVWAPGVFGWTEVR